MFQDKSLELVAAHDGNNHSMITRSTADTYRKIFARGKQAITTLSAEKISSLNMIEESENA